MNKKTITLAIIEFGFCRSEADYSDRGGCYPQKLEAEVNKLLRDLHNSSHPTKAALSNNNNNIYLNTIKLQQR